jgi:hypothetical protein
MAMVVPFPAARRRRFIAKTAARLAALSPVTADKVLAATLRQQAATLSRKNVAPISSSANAAPWKMPSAPPFGTRC